MILMEKSAIIMLLYIHRCAGVSEWQTMWTQNPLVVIPCGFDPHHRHKNPQPQGWGFFAGGGGRTERRWKHRKQSPSGALFSSRVSPYRKQYRGRSCGRFKVFPSRKAGGVAGGGGHRTSATAVINTHNPLLDALLSTEYRDAAKHKSTAPFGSVRSGTLPPSGYRAGDRDVQFAG